MQNRDSQQFHINGATAHDDGINSGIADCPGFRRPSFVVIGAVLAAVLLWVALGFVVVPGARYHDFLNLYTGASLARGGEFAALHDPVTQLARERALVPRAAQLVPFVRPHFYAALLAPLAALPFERAFILWVGLQAGLLVACCVWAWRRFGPDALVFGALFAPTALGVQHGQDCVLFLVVVIGFYVLAKRDRDWLAGGGLALGLAKFHLFLLWPVALACARRWRALGGFAAVASALGAASFALGGSAGARQYLELLRMKDLERLSPSPEQMVNVYSLPANLGIQSGAVSVALGAAVLLATIAAVWRAPLWRLVAAASCGSLLAAPHVYGYDAALLLLAAWLAIFESGQRWTRLAAATMVLPIPYLASLAGAPWSAAPALTLVAFLVALVRENLRGYCTSSLSRRSAVAASV
jgi:hypothetical protein